MFAGEMRKTYALSLVQNFPELPKGRPFPRIAEADIVTGLHDRVVDPTRLNQGLAGLCGPAAFFYCVLNYKRELYVQYVIDLFTIGKARIGSLEVKPGAACRVYQPPPAKIAAVDWVAMASLRDSDNLIMDMSSVDDDVSCGSMPGDVANWFRRIGYREVRNGHGSISARAARKSRRSTAKCDSTTTSAFSSTTTCSTITRAGSGRHS